MKTCYPLTGWHAPAHVCQESRLTVTRLFASNSLLHDERAEKLRAMRRRRVLAAFILTLVFLAGYWIGRV